MKLTIMDQFAKAMPFLCFNTLRTGDADLRF